MIRNSPSIDEGGTHLLQGEGPTVSLALARFCPLQFLKAATTFSHHDWLQYNTINYIYDSE